MLRSDRVCLALALVTAVAVGCGSSESTHSEGGHGGQGGTTTSETTTSSESTTTSDTTTGAGGGLTCENGEGPVLAVSHLEFGEGDSGEWKKVGYDLDGLSTTAVSKDVCKPNSGAFGPVPDGDNGIDNSFGKNLLPLILSLYPTWVNDINKGIDDGYFTSLLKMECLPPTGDVPVFTSKLFGGTTLGFKPSFDGTDMWPVSPELLSDPQDPQSSTVIFDQSSVTGSMFDAGKDDTFILTVPLKSQTVTTSIKLTLYKARIKMTLAADRKSATAGMIGGVLNTEEFVQEIKKVGVLLNLCDTAVFNNILDEVRRASDIMADGTQDTEQVCDGITMGLGFEMKEVQIGIVGPPAPVGDACN